MTDAVTTDLAARALRIAAAAPAPFRDDYSEWSEAAYQMLREAADALSALSADVQRLTEANAELLQSAYQYTSARGWGIIGDEVEGERIARAFHETYERLAPKFGYETRRESAVAWDEVPEQNRALMIAVAREVFPWLSRQLLDVLKGDVAAADVQRLTEERDALKDAVVEVATMLAEDERSDDVSTSESIWRQTGYREGLRDALMILRAALRVAPETP